MRSWDVEEFDVVYLHHTPQAVLVEYEGKEYWIPDSAISTDSEVYAGCKLSRGDKAKLICQEWIAKEKGMI